ncbi:MAG: tetratricopeptide repeat protein [Planctomycetota bacterium]
MAALLALTCAAAAACSSTPRSDDQALPHLGEFEAATDRDPSANTLYRMARLLQVQHRDAEVLQLLRQIVELHPEFFPAYGDLAELELRQERAGDAIKTLTRGLEQFPHEPTLLNNLGMCWFAAGRHEQALDCFTQAAAASPHERRYRANLAAVLAMLGRYDEALYTYLQVLAPAAAHHNLAVLCEARGDVGRAQREHQLADGRGDRPSD